MLVSRFGYRFDVMLKAGVGALPLLMASLSIQAVQRSGEIVVIEDVLPANVERTVSGECEGVKYEFKIAVGRSTIADSLVGAMVAGQPRRIELRRALAGLPKGSLGIFNISIDRCRERRARLQIDIVHSGAPPNIRQYFVWVGAEGGVFSDDSK
jgi:hypothetical protein